MGHHRSIYNVYFRDELLIIILKTKKKINKAK